MHGEFSERLIINPSSLPSRFRAVCGAPVKPNKGQIFTQLEKLLILRCETIHWGMVLAEDGSWLAKVCRAGSSFFEVLGRYLALFLEKRKVCIKWSTVGVGNFVWYGLMWRFSKLPTSYHAPPTVVRFQTKGQFLERWFIDLARDAQWIYLRKRFCSPNKLSLQISVVYRSFNATELSLFSRTEENYEWTLHNSATRCRKFCKVMPQERLTA